MEISRIEAERAGWPPQFANHLLANGYSNIETADILKNSLPIVETRRAYNPPEP